MDEKEMQMIIDMLDQKCESGVSRIKVEMSETLGEHETKTAYHHGRCDVGSVFAKGMKNVSCD